MFVPRNFNAVQCNNDEVTVTNFGNQIFVVRYVRLWAQVPAGESANIRCSGVQIWNLNNLAGASTVEVTEQWPDMWLPLGFDDTLLFAANGAGCHLEAVVGGDFYSGGMN